MDYWLKVLSANIQPTRAPGPSIHKVIFDSLRSIDLHSENATNVVFDAWAGGGV
jgi:hypothetical protein